MLPDSFVEEQDTGEEVTWWLDAIITVYCYEHVERFTFYRTIIERKQKMFVKIQFNSKNIMVRVYTLL